jgi:hypothetical protein
MLLHELDNDVLNIIISYLSPVRKDVVNVGLTCRALYPLAKYPEHISITYRYPFAQSVSLANLLIADPSYGTSARSVYIRVEGPNGSVARHKITTLLERLPNLQSLTLDADVRPQYAKVLLNKKLPSRSKLQYLKVVDWTITVPDIIWLLALPKLRHLELPGHAKTHPLQKIPESARLPELNHLQSLHLGTHQSWLNDEEFAKILAQCPVLESLERKVTLMPTRAPIPLPSYWTTAQPRFGLVSPARTQSALSHVSDTLVHLKLSTDRRLYSNSTLRYQGSRLDLSSFSVLKTVEIGAEFFFLPGQVEELAEFLPRSIESLKASVIFPILSRGPRLMRSV